MAQNKSSTAESYITAVRLTLSKESYNITTRKITTIWNTK